MKWEQLKKGFFGYKKSSVYEYISQMEDEFSTRLSAKDAEQKAMEEQYQKRISELEKDLLEARQQLSAYQAEPIPIAEAMIQATRFAQTLQQNAEEKAKKEREDWEIRLAEKERELSLYLDKASSVRKAFASLLQEMDQQTEAFIKQTEMVQNDAPNRNMSLFQRNDEELA